MRIRHNNSFFGLAAFGVWPWLCTLGAWLVFSAGCHRTAGIGAENGVEVEVSRLGFDPDAGTPVVILQEKAGTRMLPIWIGEPEAQAILLRLHGIQPPRPLTGDLLKAVLDKTGNRVDRVVINDLRNQTFYATIYLDHARYRIDSRPSDAIALALACKAPIFVLPRLFVTETPTRPEKPGTTLPQTRASLDGVFGVAINNIQPRSVWKPTAGYQGFALGSPRMALANRLAQARRIHAGSA